jgi:hypothetical protein
MSHGRNCWKLTFKGRAIGLPYHPQMARKLPASPRIGPNDQLLSVPHDLAHAQTHNHTRAARVAAVVPVLPAIMMAVAAVAVTILAILGERIAREGGKAERGKRYGDGFAGLHGFTSADRLASSSFSTLEQVS